MGGHGSSVRYLTNWRQKGWGQEEGRHQRGSETSAAHANQERVIQEQILIGGGKGGSRPLQGYLGTVSKSWV